METRPKTRVPLFFKALAVCFVFDGFITIALIFFIVHDLFSPLITFFVTLGMLEFFVAYLVWKGEKEGLASAAVIFGYSACSQLINMLVSTQLPPLLPIDWMLSSHSHSVPILIVGRVVIVFAILVHLLIREGEEKWTS